MSQLRQAKYSELFSNNSPIIPIADIVEDANLSLNLEGNTLSYSGAISAHITGGIIAGSGTYRGVAYEGATQTNNLNFAYNDLATQTDLTDVNDDIESKQDELPEATENGLALSRNTDGSFVYIAKQDPLPTPSQGRQLLFIDEVGNTSTGELPGQAASFFNFPTIADLEAAFPAISLAEGSIGSTTTEGRVVVRDNEWIVDIARPQIISQGGIERRQGLCNNTGRSGSSIWSHSIIKDGRPYVWGRQDAAGQNPVVNFDSDRIHAFNFAQHHRRPHPDYNRQGIGTLDPIVRLDKVHFDFGHCLSSTGLLFGWHQTSAEINHMVGSDGTTVTVSDRAVPIFFDNGDGTNQPIRDYDISSWLLNTVEIYGGLYIGTDDSVWVMTNNLDNYTLDAAVPSTGTAQPTKINKTEWNGLTPKKVRVQSARDYCVLFTNGDLYACGFNAEGQFGLGNATRQNDFVLIASNVADFDTGQDTAGSDFIYYLTNSNELFGAGDNGSGWLNNGNVTNVTTFDQIDTGVTRVISGGNGSFHALAYIKNDTWYRVGENRRGTFGNSSITNLSTSEVWTELNDLITANGALIDGGFGSYINNGLVLSAFLFANGKVFAAGEGSTGQLGDGNLSDATVFVEAEFQLEQGEIVESLFFYNDSNSNPQPHFGLITNYGNVLMTGEDLNGLASGGESTNNNDYATFKKVENIKTL